MIDQNNISGISKSDANLELKIKTLKSILRYSIIVFVLIVFIIPFAVFSIITLNDYLVNNSSQNLSSFLLMLIVLICLVIFYILFEVLLFKRVKSNQKLLRKEFYLLSCLTFIFTFITSFWLLIISIKEFFVISGTKLKLFKKEKR